MSRTANRRNCTVTTVSSRRPLFSRGNLLGFCLDEEEDEVAQFSESQWFWLRFVFEFVKVDGVCSSGTRGT